MSRLFNNLSRPIWIAVATLFLSMPLVTGSQASASLNIARFQYESALAKWNSLQIREYEELYIHPISGTWNLTVRVDGTSSEGKMSETVLHIVRPDGYSLPQSELDGSREMTIGEAFSFVDDLLKRSEGYDSRTYKYTPGSWVIEFDNDMGFPRTLTLLAVAFPSLEQHDKALSIEIDIRSLSYRR